METNMGDQKGLTLIELMVTVAIIGILAAVAIPIFQNHRAIARQSEAKINLAAIYTHQIEFQAVSINGFFSTTFQSTGYTPAGWPTRYAFVVGNSGGSVPTVSINPIDAGADRIDPVSGSPGAFPPGCTASTSLVQASFVAVAYGNIDTADNTLDCWTMDETRTLVNVSNDVSS